ncbi:MAG: chemotaxis protein CheW [Thioalkalivibrionaceae bacterium]
MPSTDGAAQPPTASQAAITRPAVTPQAENTRLRIQALEPVEASADLVEASADLNEERPQVPTTFVKPNDPIDVIRLSTAGIELLIAVREIATILRAFPERLVRMPGSPIWKLGITEHEGRTLQVISIDALLATSRPGMNTGVDHAARLNPPSPGSQGGAGQFWLVLADAPIAIAVDRVFRTERIATDRLRFRNQRRNLAWIAGIERDSLATLLDLKPLIESLPQAIRGHGSHTV